MSPLLLEIRANGDDPGGPAAPIVIAPPAGDEPGWRRLLPPRTILLRVEEDGRIILAPPRGLPEPMDIGQWHEAGGWRLRICDQAEAPGEPARPACPSWGAGEPRAPGGPAESIADNPSWAAPEIRITTYDGERARQLRCMLPAEENAQLVIGRGGPGADVILEDEHVSRLHARFFVTGGQWMVEDLGSRWGTRLNGEPLIEPRPVKHGDELRLGKSTIQYLCYFDLLPAAGEAPSQGSQPQASPEPPARASAGPSSRASPPPSRSTPPARRSGAQAPPSGQPAAPQPAEEIPPPVEPPAEPDPGPRAVAPAQPTRQPNAPAAARARPEKPRPPAKRNYFGFDIGGAIFIVLALLAGLAYLAYVVFYR